MSERHPFTEWSLRERKGHDTPSAEEWFWYTVLPGGLYRTLTSGNPEDLDYYMATGMVWLGGMAYAASEAAAGSFAAEVSLARNVSMIHAGSRLAVRSVLPVLGTVAAVEVTRSALGSQVDAASGQGPGNPWWMPLPLYLTLFG